MSKKGPRRLANQVKRLGCAAAVMIATLNLVGCRRSRATSEDCQEILDRIVQLEFEERGFRDPVLIDRKRREMRDLLASELKECTGKRLKAGALACVRSANNTAKISHDCLR
jgi:hypothetical protein